MLNYNDQVMKREQFRDFVRDADVARLARTAHSREAKGSPFYATALRKFGALLVSVGSGLEVRFGDNRSALAH